MYNETLAQQILDVLNKAFPEKLGLADLKKASQEFSQLPNEDWLLAIDALNKEGLVDGLLSRLGAKKVLRAAAHLEITPAGRRKLAELRVEIEDSLRDESADLDPLLQIYNRGRFDTDIKQLVDSANNEHPLSLVMIDVDHFKKVNDTFGHPFGDEVLKKIAELVRLASGKKGKCFRYGGEEIAVLLPNYSPDEAVALAERVRLTVGRANFPPISNGVTISLGVATLPGHSMDVESLKNDADQAMYQAKSLGRNLVRSAGEPGTVATPTHTVSRRMPETSGLTQQQAQEIYESYFRGYEVRCPHDQALLHVTVAHEMGRKTPRLFVNCPLCGLNDQLEGQG